ncbi:MAG: hypothetical protein QNJ72_33695 [Pleurocapsa sp. MO_226.B13]|nr:hypothetical protein [Pleurocapsa sp. MO_226.B13]
MGNINLEVNDILSITNRSEINTNAQDFGDGGNINIDTTLVVVSEGSEITANALSGQGGNISIEAKDLFLTPDSQVSASSELGIDGQVEITTFTTSDRYNLAELPQQVLQADNLIVKTCNMKNNGKDVFIYTGRGGLPANPLVEAQGDKMVIADFTIPQDSITGNKFKTNPLNLNPPTPKIVEAEGWKVNQNGKVELIASSNNLVENFDFYVASCP